MELRITGYDFAPRQQYESEFSNFVSTGGWAGASPLVPPLPARPVLADERGNQFISVPGENSVTVLPYIPGSSRAEKPASRLQDYGGFVPLEDMPSGVGAAGTPDVGLGGNPSDMLQGMMAQIPSKMVASWLGNAASNAMLGGGPGGALNAAMQTLGLSSPLASGPIGAAMGTALSASGLGAAGSHLPSVGSMLTGGGMEGLASSMGNAALNGLLSSTGVPGAGALGSLAGGSLADVMSTGGWAGPLDDAGGCFGGCFPGGDAGPDIIGDPTNGGCFGTGGGPDLNAIGADALNSAADQLLSQWQVDDESSAAEHIANKAVNDNKAQIKEAVSDPDGFAAKMKKFFSGEAPGSGMPAVRITDQDNFADISNMGVGNILFEGLPVSRITDTVVGPKAPAPTPITEGAATVLSAGLPTAFLSAKTAVPSVMVKGAGTIKVGGTVASINPPQSAANPDVAGNGGPAAPDGPASAETGSGGSGGNEGGSTDSADAGDEQTGSTKPVDDAGPAGAEAETLPPASDTAPDSLDENAPSSSEGDLDGGSEDGPMCKPEQWRDQLAQQLEDEKAGVCWKDPTAKVMADGTLSDDEHLNRNDYNYCPTQKPAGEVDGINWEEKSGIANLYHRPLECTTGQPIDGSLGPGSFECCYYPGSGQLIDNAQQSGTYNYAHGTGFVVPGTTIPVGQHGKLDVLPHDKNSNYSHVNMSLRPPQPPPSLPPSPGFATHMNPADAPPGTLAQPGMSNSPPVGGFTVDPVTGKMIYG